MNPRKKAAAVSTCLNILLTLLKFLLFFFTGSLAILAEAWHSFSDIGTSMLVFLAVLKEPEKSEEGDEPAEGRASLAERIIAMAIGVFLSVVAVVLIVQFFRVDPVPVRNPLLAGCIFLGFSLGSFLVSRYETMVGRAEGSVGLIADGMHAKADMVASLITGFSLILYHLGLDLDRWVAGLIALFILSFGIETVINAVLSLFGKKASPSFGGASRKIQTALVERRNWITIFEFIRSREVQTLFKNGIVVRTARLVSIVVLIGLACWLASTCFFFVKITEQAVVERFGRPIEQEEGFALDSGLHFKLPWPLDRAVIRETHPIRQMSVGNEVMDQNVILLWTLEHGDNIPFISGDNNYFYPYIVVHYRIRELYDFLYRHVDAEKLLHSITMERMTRLFSTMSFFDIVLEYKPVFEKRMLAEVQADMDGLGTGIEIVSVNVKDIHPPVNVSSTFENVIAALQQKEEMVNKAMGMASEKLCTKRGEAARLKEEAVGFMKDLKLRSEGDASHFTSLLPDDERIKAITKKRLYLEAMIEALTEREMILYDRRAGIPEIWLNPGLFSGFDKLELDENQF